MKTKLFTYKGTRVIVSDDGRVWIPSHDIIMKSGVKRHIPLHELKPCPDGGGHLYVHLHPEPGKNVVAKVHQIVLTAFQKNPDPKNFTDINHINGDKTDNRLENLEWCTRSHNLKHAYIMGLNTGHPKTRVQWIETGQIFNSLCEAAKCFNTDESTIKRTCERQGTIRKQHIKIIS